MILQFLRRRQTPYFPGEDTQEHGNLRLDAGRKRAIETGRTRLILTGGVFLLAFTIIAGRMVDVSILRGVEPPQRQARQQRSLDLETERADITDRNGVLLATSLPTVSLYAHPREVLDPADAAAKLAAVLPEINRADVQSRLSSDRGFVYLRRNLTPKQQYEVNAQGIPGLYFEKGERRVYPQGNLVAHVVGMTDLDNKGIAGIEKTFEADLRASRQPLRLSLDLRVQTILRNELTRAVTEFRAVGATGMVMDVRTGELIAMVSLPDFDPNNLSSATPEAMFNRATLGVYEMGSTFKLFNTAAALDSGVANPNSLYDVSSPIKIARFTISDTHPIRHPISVSEVLIHSSNIGSAKMALDMGTDVQKTFMAKLGMLRAIPIQLPEVGSPLVPSPWREINTMTIAFGHGIAVTPLHLISGVSALVNGGIYRSPTLLRRDAGFDDSQARQVIRPETSREIRHMMRAVVTEGTGSKAEVAGYEVGGKTGTAEKNGAGGYRHKSLLSSFIATFPTSDPRYVVLAMIDEPQGTKETFGFATGGWTGAPVVGRVVSQIGPLLGIPPIPGDAQVQKSRMVQNAVVRTPVASEAE